MHLSIYLYISRCVLADLVSLETKAIEAMKKVASVGVVFASCALDEL